jgi:Flp pilus assembly protein TadG
VLSRERGSVLLLMPAAVLIVIVLASLCVDFAIAFLGEREVSSLAQSAANDAATAAVDQDHLRETGEFRLDPERVEQVVAATIAASSTEVDLEAPRVEVTVIDGEPAVRVELTGTVDYVFAPVLPGGPDGVEVSAAAVGVATEG